ncbi:hypothetical protein [Aliiroseovarius crassostreae]|uniref:hypothetical protein n=1 Tax=Aliiroseovarius crassostreae TaxID=154981 RepID=UPI003C7BCDFE
MVFSIFRLLAGARTQVLFLTVPYLVVLVVYSVISALLLAQINPEPQILQYLQITSWLSVLTRLLLAVLMAIGLWRFLLLREKPRWCGLHTRPGVVWPCLWRGTIVALIWWFGSEWVGYFSYLLWAVFQSQKLDPIPFEVFGAAGLFVRYFLMMHLMCYLWLGFIAVAVGHKRVSMIRSVRICMRHRKEIMVGCAFLAAIAVLSDLGIMLPNWPLAQLGSRWVSIVLLNAGTSIFVLLVPLIVFWGTVAMMAMIYAREIRAPVSSAKVNAD